MPEDYRFIRLPDRDREILRTISDVFLAHCQSVTPTNRPAADEMAIGDASAEHLVELLRLLVGDPSFVQRTNFMESMGKDNWFDNTKLAKLYFANSRGLGVRSTEESVAREWQVLARAYATMSYHEFLAREGELLRRVGINPSVVALLIDMAFRFERVMDESALRARLSRKGTFVRAVNKTSSELEGRLQRPTFNGTVSKTKLAGAAFIVADAAALFGGARLSATAVISGLGAAAINLLMPDDFEKQAEGDT